MVRREWHPPSREPRYSCCSDRSRRNRSCRRTTRRVNRMLRLAIFVSASSITLKSNLRSSGASGGNVRGSVGCSCRHETRKLASYDAGHAGYRCCAGLPCGKSGCKRSSYWPRSGLGISSTVRLDSMPESRVRIYDPSDTVAPPKMTQNRPSTHANIRARSCGGCEMFICHTPITARGICEVDRRISFEMLLPSQRTSEHLTEGCARA